MSLEAKVPSTGFRCKIGVYTMGKKRSIKDFITPSSIASDHILNMIL